MSKINKVDIIETDKGTFVFNLRVILEISGNGTVSICIHGVPSKIMLMLENRNAEKIISYSLTRRLKFHPKYKSSEVTFYQE